MMGKAKKDTSLEGLAPIYTNGLYSAIDLLKLDELTELILEECTPLAEREEESCCQKAVFERVWGQNPI